MPIPIPIPIHLHAYNTKASVYANQKKTCTIICTLTGREKKREIESVSGENVILIINIIIVFNITIITFISVTVFVFVSADFA